MFKTNFMTTVDRLIELLVSNSWKENLNIWTFRKKTITIKDYSLPGFEKVFEYFVEVNGENKFLLKTNDRSVGDLSLYVSSDHSKFQIILQSVVNECQYYKLQAFHGFSVEQRKFVESRLKLLRKGFEFKKKELQNRIVQIRQTPNPNKKLVIKRCEDFMMRMHDRIEMVEMVIQTTLNLANNFSEYVKQLEIDVSKLEEDIKSFDVTKEC
jgi:hypothetical protein